MILLDSLYINNSGGLRLLEYLIAELQKSKIEYYLLADFRCMGKFDKCKHVQYMKASLWKRKKLLGNEENASFSISFCFLIGILFYVFQHFSSDDCSIFRYVGLLHVGERY